MYDDTGPRKGTLCFRTTRCHSTIKAFTSSSLSASHHPCISKSSCQGRYPGEYWCAGFTSPCLVPTNHRSGNTKTCSAKGMQPLIVTALTGDLVNCIESTVFHGYGVRKPTSPWSTGLVLHQEHILNTTSCPTLLLSDGLSSALVCLRCGTTCKKCLRFVQPSLPKSPARCMGKAPPSNLRQAADKISRENHVPNIQIIMCKK
jgi:hypothetical protein